MSVNNAFESWLYEATVDKLWSALPNDKQEELLRMVTYVANEFGEQQLLPDV